VPILRVSPSETVQVGDTVTFDSRHMQGDPDDNVSLATR
jgi:hypothetical protein